VKPFVVRKLPREFGSRPWGVFERVDEKEQLVCFWETREQAREAARQLNKEEP
jgi:hypothetical protein